MTNEQKEQRSSNSYIDDPIDQWFRNLYRFISLGLAAASFACVLSISSENSLDLPLKTAMWAFSVSIPLNICLGILSNSMHFMWTRDLRGLIKVGCPFTLISGGGLLLSIIGIGCFFLHIDTGYGIALFISALSSYFLLIVMLTQLDRAKETHKEEGHRKKNKTPKV